MKYTVDYFIEKFEAIPEKNWTTGNFRYGDKYCALGFCGAHESETVFSIHTEESKMLLQLTHHVIPAINDGKHPEFKQKTPRGRVLAALRAIKKGKF